MLAVSWSIDHNTHFGRLLMCTFCTDDLSEESPHAEPPVQPARIAGFPWKELWFVTCWLGCLGKSEESRLIFLLLFFSVSLI